jgi:hypothetical protein
MDSVTPLKVNLAYQPANEESMAIVAELKQAGCVLNTISSTIAYELIRSPVGQGREEEIDAAAEFIAGKVNQRLIPEDEQAEFGPRRYGVFLGVGD